MGQCLRLSAGSPSVSEALISKHESPVCYDITRHPLFTVVIIPLFVCCIRTKRGRHRDNGRYVTSNLLTKKKINLSFLHLSTKLIEFMNYYFLFCFIWVPSLTRLQSSFTYEDKSVKRLIHNKSLNYSLKQKNRYSEYQVWYLMYLKLYPITTYILLCFLS